MVRGRGLSVGLVAVVALVVGALSWMGWRLVLNSGQLLTAPSWLSAALLVVLAGLVLSAGMPVRRFLRGQATRPLSPIRATRTLVMAQAGALTGAAVLGWYGAQAILALSDLDLDHNREVIWPLITLTVAGLLLASAGLATQRMCRIDEPPKDE